MEVCNSCKAGCCRNFTVSLTGYDILNISKSLNLAPSSFIQIVPVEDDIDFQYKSQYAALFKFSDTGNDKFYTLGMKMMKSHLFSETVKCIFLQEWHSNYNSPSFEGLTVRCGIYESRPLVCRSFPYKFDQTERRVLTYDFSLSYKSDEHPVYDLCSRKLNKTDLAYSSDKIVHSLVLRKYEVEYFQTLADYWNRNPGTLSEFLHFATNAYNHRIVID